MYSLRIIGDGSYIVSNDNTNIAIAIIRPPVNVDIITSRSEDYIVINNDSNKICTLKIKDISELQIVAGEKITTYRNLDRNIINQVISNIKPTNRSIEDILSHQFKEDNIQLNRMNVLGVTPTYEAGKIGTNLQLDAGMKINNSVNLHEGSTDKSNVMLSTESGEVKVVSANKYLAMYNESNNSIDDINNFIKSPEYSGEYDKEGLIVYVKRSNRYYKRKFDMITREWVWDTASMNSVWYEGDDYPTEYSDVSIYFDEGSTSDIDESTYSTGQLFFDEGSTPDIDESAGQSDIFWNEMQS